MAPPPRTRCSIIRFLPFAASTTPLQAITYLLGISLFSISFLVFLNSSVSFVITDLIGVKDGVGDIVGTLGFVDEVVALIACPIWGLVSDRMGVRYVAVAGYTVIGLSLFLFVQAHNVYPQLLLARIFFAVGATASATMVTAILPSLTNEKPHPSSDDLIPKPPGRLDPRRQRQRQSITPSIDSEVTITPERFRNNSSSIGSSSSGSGSGSGSYSHNGDGITNGGHPDSTTASCTVGSGGKPSALAGYVGLFTGCGALVALSLFLPLPARFGKIAGVTLGDAVKYSFYVVGVISLCVAVFVFFGLRGLKGEEGKGWRMLFGLPPSHNEVGSNIHAVDFTRDEEDQDQRIAAPKQVVAPYWQLLRESISLGFTDSEITLGYLGGFVARASTVAISLFMPLFVNAYFFGHGFCHGSPNDPSPELKKECRQAYVLASILTGVAQLTGLICAPVFGYLSSRAGTNNWRVNYPILVATVFGIWGYLGFSRLESPEYKDVDGRGGSPVVFLFAALVGVSQIGAIVCSLGSLGRGVLKGDVVAVVGGSDGGDQETLVETPVMGTGSGESAPLLRGNGGRRGIADEYGGDEVAVVVPVEDVVSRVRLKGSVAGVYSWCGGAAILLLTKLGGWLFDAWDTGAPFYLMAGFNAVLLVASLGIDISKARARARANSGLGTSLSFR